MIGALYNGLSGVTSTSKGVNVTANNIANVNTVGYKSDTMQFARMMYSNPNSSGAVGNGVGTMKVEKDFDQGELKQSQSFYDFAIDGKGFFAVNDLVNNDMYYTRAGTFQKSLDGFLEDKNNFRVQGTKTTISDTSSINGDTIFDESYTKLIGTKTIGTQDFTISINARSNDYSKSATDIGTSGTNYKTKGTLLADIDTLISNYNSKLSQYASNPNANSVASTNQKVEITFGNWQNDLSTDTSYIQLYIGSSAYRQNFDTDATTTMNLLADKISNLPGFSASFDATNSLLTVDNLIPGNNTPITMPLGDYASPTIVDTPAVEGSGLAMVDSARDALKDRIALANGQFLEIQNTIPAPNQTSVTLQDLDLKLNSLGFSVNNDSTFEATDDGVLLVNQLGNSYVVGRLSTVYFPDPITLEPTGSNLYAETQESGEPKNADMINTIYTKFQEMSNTNLAAGFTDVLRSQRAFEASSKAITTSDDFLKTAIQLKK